jgi:hypothetical protein
VGKPVSAKPLSQKLGVPRCAALFSNNFPNLLEPPHRSFFLNLVQTIYGDR